MRTPLPTPGPADWLRPSRRAPRGGRRSGVLADLQLACSAPRYDVDVLARDLERPRGIEITGQVTWAQDPHVPADGVSVALLAAPGGGVLARTRTNAFGEFTFARQPGRTLGLRVGDGPGAFSLLVWEPDL